MYVIRRYNAGELSPGHGRKWHPSKMEAARQWMYRECVMDGGTYTGKHERFKEDYMGYPDQREEDTIIALVWEDDPEVNEFGVVLP